MNIFPALGSSIVVWSARGGASAASTCWQPSSGRQQFALFDSLTRRTSRSASARRCNSTRRGACSPPYLRHFFFLKKRQKKMALSSHKSTFGGCFNDRSLSFGSFEIFFFQNDFNWNPTGCHPIGGQGSRDTSRYTNGVHRMMLKLKLTDNFIQTKRIRRLNEFRLRRDLIGGNGSGDVCHVTRSWTVARTASIQRSWSLNWPTISFKWKEFVDWTSFGSDAFPLAETGHVMSVTWQGPEPLHELRQSNDREA